MVGTKIGVIGGGQLGRMLALAAYPLGLRFHFYDTSMDCPASHVGPVFTGSFEDTSRVADFAGMVDILTFEFENVPSSSIAKAESIKPVYPSHKVLAVSQDRLLEKQLFKELGLATPKFAAVGSLDELVAGAHFVGLPCVLKSRRLGYDGKGQAVIRTADEMESAWTLAGTDQSIVEEFIDFDEEISAIGVRSRAGVTRFYPVCHNKHEGGILRQTWIDPAEGNTALSGVANAALTAVMKTQDYIGVLALEMFVRRGQLIANEMAPRVHNSGHWTIDGAPTSQFENHIRAITGLPLGDVVPERPAGMVNIIGDLPDIDALIALPYARLHLYDKEPREGRKLGHVNVLAKTKVELMERLKIVEQIVVHPVTK